MSHGIDTTPITPGAGVAVVTYGQEDGSQVPVSLLATTDGTTTTPVDASHPLPVAQTGALPAGTNVIGHVIVDSAASVTVTSLPAITFAAPQHVIIDSATLGTVTVSGTVAATQSGTWTVQQGSAPWSVSQSGTWNVGLSAGTNVIGHVIVDSVGSTVNTNDAGQSAIVDANNSTTSTLGSGAVFTGTATDTLNYSAVNWSVFADQAGTLSQQYSQDGTHWDDAVSFSIAQSLVTHNSGGPRARYFRLVYTNGATPQTTFRLQTILKIKAPEQPSIRVATNINSEEDAILARALVSGEDAAASSVYRTLPIRNASSPAQSTDKAVVVDVRPGGIAATAANQASQITLLAGGLPAALGAGGGVKIDGSGTALPVSGTVTANVGTTNGIALDATLTGGSQVAIAKSGTKGTSGAALVTSTASGVNHQPFDVILYDASGNALLGIPAALGQALAAACMPVVLPSAQDVVAYGPAKESGGNLATLAGAVSGGRMLVSPSLTVAKTSNVVVGGWQVKNAAGALANLIIKNGTGGSAFAMAFDGSPSGQPIWQATTSTASGSYLNTATVWPIGFMLSCSTSIYVAWSTSQDTFTAPGSSTNSYGWAYYI